jgi:hypothetical protein
MLSQKQYTGDHVRHTGGKWRKPKNNKNKWEKHGEKQTKTVCFEKQNISMETSYQATNMCLSCNTYGYYNGETQCKKCYENDLLFCHFCKTVDCYEPKCGKLTCDVEMCGNHNCKVSNFCYKHQN